MMLWRWFRIELPRIAAVAAGNRRDRGRCPSSSDLAFLVAVLGLAWLTAGRDDEAGEWFNQAWTYTKQIVPLLLGGVLVAGFLLGRPGHEGLIPSAWISGLVGGNSIASNLFAAIAGAFMYFATLTEVPIVQGLVGSGMGSGPALALLLAGPALSLPSMLVLQLDPRPQEDRHLRLAGGRHGDRHRLGLRRPVHLMRAIPAGAAMKIQILGSGCAKVPHADGSHRAGGARPGPRVRTRESHRHDALSPTSA